MVDKYTIINVVANKHYDKEYKEDLKTIKNFLFENGFDVTMREAEVLWSEYSGDVWLKPDLARLSNILRWLNNLLEDMRC